MIIAFFLLTTVKARIKMICKQQQHIFRPHKQHERKRVYLNLLLFNLPYNAYVCYTYTRIISFERCE